MPYILTTERLGLRRWEEADLAPFAAMNKNPEVMRFYPATLTVEETRAMVGRIEARFQERGFGLFAVEKLATKEFIGYTGFTIPLFDSFFTPCVEIGWRIRKADWNQGFATEAPGACLRHGFDVLGFDEIYSFTSVPNQPSVRVMQKIGMTKAGEFDHPLIEKGSPLCRHVLYSIGKAPDRLRETN